MKAIEGQATYGAVKRELQVRSGFILPDTNDDILKAVVVERYGRTPPNIGKGFVTGFELKAGALATSVSADTHHLISVGTNDEDMMNALNTVIDLQGGMVVVENGHILARLPLPIGGFISTQNSDRVASSLRELDAGAKKLGCKLTSPFTALSLLGNPSLPELRLSDRGLIHMSSRIIPLEVD
jgi:adenine deaminase